MLEGKLEDLITERHVKAFRELWAIHGDDAREDFLRILSMFSEPLDHDEIERFGARFIMGLVGDRPDPAAWLEAEKTGSFAVSKAGIAETPAQLSKRARALARRRGLFIGDIEEHRRAWADDAANAQHQIRLLVLTAVGKELSKNVAAKAALGPAWPLMVAVNDHCSAKVKRGLHQFGAEKRLHELLSFGVQWALRRFARETYPDGAPESGRSADWRTSLPPGVDVRAHFARPKQTKPEPAAQIEKLTDVTYDSVKQRILAGARPSFLDFKALKDRLEAVAAAKAAATETTDLNLFVYDIEPETLPWPFTWMMSYACSSPAECFSRAMRAFARQAQREQLAIDGSGETETTDYKVQVWLSQWVEEGGGVPKNLPFRYLSYLEEEACLAFETHGEQWSGYSTWSAYRFLPKERSTLKPATLTDAPDIQPELQWIAPPRIVDRILVNESTKEAHQDSEQPTP